jgi:hypothetical protein
VKRCCGVDGVRDRERRVGEAAAELFDLAKLFPRYRPASISFDAWARTAPDAFSREALGEGMGRLGDSERERIVQGFQAEYPALWSSVVADLEDEPLAAEIVLGGAVVAGVLERRQPIDAEGLDMLEDYPDAQADPVEALALVLHAQDRWSVIESGEAIEALDRAGDLMADRVLAAEAERRATTWHHDRLRVLLGRVQSSLPVPGYPLASEALARACEQLQSDKSLHRRLLAELLLDSIDPLPLTFAAAA